MWSNDKDFPGRGFLTPQPPAWKKPQSTNVLPMSERKRISPANNGDCFHVIHKVPPSDSPYGRAKQVQLIEKDPSKAISLFWAAINAGDRVDSALKDMAVVMKQLNRSDEAIEAIKSFRHLCPYDSQDSLDNVLVELYKRSGRVEEEIGILQNKLRNIDDGAVFGGKRTKLARSQGKKIQITIEQEKSRILGNLAWAYLQQHNYGIAEQHYRKALSLEPDKNKQCNLAICLVHMNRIGEAKSLLQDVKASSGNEHMDESYSKSYERALEVLMKIESQSMLEPVAQEPDKGSETRRSSTSNRDRSLKEASVVLPRNEVNIPGFMGRRRLQYAQCEGKMLSDEQNGESDCKNHLEKNDNFYEYDDRSSQCTPIGLKGTLQSSPQTLFTEKWRKGSYMESPCEGSVYSSKLNENWRYSTGQEVDSVQKKIYASSAANRKNSEALFTQPRQCSWGFNTADQRRGGRWGGDTVRNSIRKLSFEQTLATESLPSPSIQNLKEEPQASSNGKLENSATGLEEEEVQDGLSGVLFTQPRNSLLWLNNRDQRRGRWAEESVGSSVCKLSFEKTITSVTRHSAQNLNELLVSSKDESEIGLEKPANAPNKKSWADMVEEEEEKEELQSGRKYLGKSYEGFNREEEFNDENLNSNIIYQHPDSKDHIENIAQQLESFDMKGGYNASPNTVLSRRNRLQVFRDITSP
ncbi:uncharacterized protein LOC111274098 [Durio zibethinus]|uniref:Uncharacterized protein LOC111274098 n=1 Tax=Durio zibethinus TaxID=66656 RepID=A0A6P5WEN4_DURZI|nr:uncharacterized protein LOC111274098 [Durio zibethinus]